MKMYAELQRTESIEVKIKNLTITYLGDEGPALAGLNKVYYNPSDFLVLPFHHNYTETGEWVNTAYFMPAYITMNKKEYVGSRGEYLLEKQKEYYTERRNSIKDPQTLLKHKAEQCFTAEEAFAAEGVNKFNKLKIADQIIRLRVTKDKPIIQRGYMQFIFKGPSRDRKDITGVKFVPSPNGSVLILQPPLWEITNQKEPGESVEEYEERKNQDEFVTEKINNLYVGGIDGIDIGQAETSDQTRDPSKFCTVIKRRIYGLKEPTYVAYYLDRPNDVRDAYIQTIGLLMWYNCQANLEATRMSVLTYARDNKFMQYFMKRPRVCSGDINARKPKNSQYGTTATTAMIDHQTDLVRDYVEDYCHNIWFLEMLDQLNKYTDENKGKFDLVAAMSKQICSLIQRYIM